MLSKRVRSRKMRNDIFAEICFDDFTGSGSQKIFIVLCTLTLLKLRVWRVASVQ